MPTACPFPMRQSAAECSALSQGVSGEWRVPRGVAEVGASVGLSGSQKIGAALKSYGKRAKYGTKLEPDQGYAALVYIGHSAERGCGLNEDLQPQPATSLTSGTLTDSHSACDPLQCVASRVNAHSTESPLPYLASDCTEPPRHPVSASIIIR